MKVIAKIQNEYTEKFGVPRQSGRVESTVSKIVFEKEFSSPDAVRGIEGFSHLWLIFGFDKTGGKYRLTVRPPRLGGNKKVGVFASRSPFRPNSLGLSSVKLERVEITENGTVLYVSGADLLSGTPIYDIKPYLTFTDCHLDAKNGYAEDFINYYLAVENTHLLNGLPTETKNKIISALKEDPRPSYHKDGREYGANLFGAEIKFKVEDKTLYIIKVN
ncbi:MAG: tRNA (N6-threonylcarbamoyladenosine(37)-N6)-methyltransferase TrmO [Clostridia bacterium]|nr:tRNA (N6-threonylcarbamoyladenosine(37)-N6)-methyltransferase TrmO [Clostridia bacterium]